ncbi:hypothetical protein [Paenibacillus sp. MBLB4367]|uniref:hypothetical protein n=1 Tax=Paenibacillus sp. MBLB4367 TaxID=3384767 RepID=UPI0039082A42
MGDKLDLILHKVDRIQNDVEVLKTDVNSLLAGQSELYQIYRALRERQDESDAKLDAMAMDVHRMHGDITSLKDGQFAMQSDITELKEGQRIMLSIQQEQQKILERLSIRSVSQEADIAELRRIK